MKTGAGKFTLNGTQTYTNLTAINAGTLEFAGTPPAGDITNNAALSFKPAASLYPGTSAARRSLNQRLRPNRDLDRRQRVHGRHTNTAGTLQLGNNTAAGSGPVTYLTGAVKVGSDWLRTLLHPRRPTDLI